MVTKLQFKTGLTQYKADFQQVPVLQHIYHTTTHHKSHLHTVHNRNIAHQTSVGQSHILWSMNSVCKCRY